MCATTIDTTSTSAPARHARLSASCIALSGAVLRCPLCRCLNHRVTALGHNVQQHTLTLRQADAARADFALIESNLEYIASQLAQRPTRGDLAKTALGIIFCSAILTTLFV